MADQQLVDEVDRPEDIVDDQQDNGMVVMPADQQGIEAQDAVDNAVVSVVHTPKYSKKYAADVKKPPFGGFLNI
jgi:hypothetical protein